MVVSLATFASRILGFARDMVIAGLFGTGAGADVFFVAFRIPNFLRRLVGEGAFSQAFVPVLAEQISQGNQTDEQELINHVFGALLTVVCLITLIAVIAAPILILFVAPGYSFPTSGEEHKYDLLVTMLRITFPYLAFISITAFFSSILNCHHRYGWPALTPVLLNLSLISAALFLSPRLQEPVIALAWGVFIGGALQLAWQLPLLRKIARVPKFKLDWKHPGVVRIFKLLLPATFGVSVSQINLLFDTILASFLTTGSVSWLYYSDRLMEFPLGVFAIALGTVLLPHLSKLHAQDNPEHYRETLDWGLRWVCLIGLPASTALFVLAGPLLTTLFQYGEFSAHDVTQASLSLKAYATALLGAMLIKILAPGFYARQDVKTPVRIAVIALLSNMVLNILLIMPLAHTGLALATSCSAFINAWLLYRALSARGIYQPSAGWGPFLLRLTLSTLLMAVTLVWIAGSLDGWLILSASERAWFLSKTILLGALSYLLVLLLSGLDMKSMIRPAVLKLR